MSTIGKARRWFAKRSPLAWPLVTPVLTVPLSALLVFAFAQDLDAPSLGLPIWRNEAVPARLYYFEFWPTYLLLTGPGVLNLLVVLWAFQRNGYVRVAAGVGLVVAIVRSFVVVLVFFAIAQSDVISHEGGLLIRMEVENRGIISLDDHSPGTALLRLLSTTWLFGAYAWGGSLLVWGLYNLAMDRLLPDLKPPKPSRAREPTSWGGFFERR